MFQICDEIILELLKGAGSISAIAKNIGSNKTSVMRTVNDLLKENIVDYRIEGRNKIIYLKKGLTARNYVYRAEQYKLNKIFAKYPKLKIILKEVLDKAKKAEMIILFGSYAKLIAKDTSDIDVYVETDDRTLKKSLEGDRLSIKIGKFDLENPLVKEIIKHHAIVKGVERFYEKTGFFEEA